MVADRGRAAQRIRGILFDKDGTLIEFHATWMPAYRAGASAACTLLARPGLEARLLEVAGYDRRADRCAPGSALACGTTREIVDLWCAELGGGDPATLAREVNTVFLEHAARRAVPVTDLVRQFSGFLADGLILGVATMDQEARTHATMERLGVASLLDFVCGCDSGHGEKPGPGMVHAFCDATGLTPDQIAVVGDTPHDLNMGRAAGAAMVLGVLTGASTLEVLAPLADRVLADITEIADLLADRTAPQ